MTPEALAAQRQEWRKARIQARKSMSADARAAADTAIAARLRAMLDTISDGIIGFYWPIQGEFNAQPAVADWLAQGSDPGNGRPGRRAALPVVVARHQPVKFRAWTPATVLQPAGFGTFVPSSGEWLVPTVLVIPLVGFDDARYRLGYGGGYYDRTLAAASPKPRTIGIGYAAGHLATIHPQSYDLQLDSLITG